MREIYEWEEMRYVGGRNLLHGRSVAPYSWMCVKSFERRVLAFFLLFIYVPAEIRRWIWCVNFVLICPCHVSEHDWRLAILKKNNHLSLLGTYALPLHHQHFFFVFNFLIFLIFYVYHLLGFSVLGLAHLESTLFFPANVYIPLVFICLFMCFPILVNYLN